MKLLTIIHVLTIKKQYTEQFFKGRVCVELSRSYVQTVVPEQHGGQHLAIGFLVFAEYGLHLSIETYKKVDMVLLCLMDGLNTLTHLYTCWCSSGIF